MSTEHSEQRFYSKLQAAYETHLRQRDLPAVESLLAELLDVVQDRLGNKLFAVLLDLGYIEKKCASDEISKAVKNCHRSVDGISYLHTIISDLRRRLPTGEPMLEP